MWQWYFIFLICLFCYLPEFGNGIFQFFLYFNLSFLLPHRIWQWYFSCCIFVILYFWFFLYAPELAFVWQGYFSIFFCNFIFFFHATSQNLLLCGNNGILQEVVTLISEWQLYYSSMTNLKYLYFSRRFLWFWLYFLQNCKSRKVQFAT